MQRNVIMKLSILCTFLCFCVKIFNKLLLFSMKHVLHDCKTPSWSHNTSLLDFVGKRLVFLWLYESCYIFFCSLQYHYFCWLGMSRLMQETRREMVSLCKMSFPNLLLISFLSLVYLLQTPVGDQMGQSAPGCFGYSCIGGYRKSDLRYNRHSFFIPELPFRKCMFLFFSDQQQFYLPMFLS